MKYLKGSFIFLVISVIFFSTGASAVVGISNVTIPIFSGTWSTSTREKNDFSYQAVKKISCTDNVSGDGRVIFGALSNMDSYQTSGDIGQYIEIPYSYTDFSYFNSPGRYKLYLKSKKSLPTQATFSGTWRID